MWISVDLIQNTRINVQLILNCFWFVWFSFGVIWKMYGSKAEYETKVTRRRRLRDAREPAKHRCGPTWLPSAAAASLSKVSTTPSRSAGSECFWVDAASRRSASRASGHIPASGNIFVFLPNEHTNYYRKQLNKLKTTSQILALIPWSSPSQ